MSFVVTAPELVAAAAGDLAGIGSSLGEATAAAAPSTTGVAAAAADEVSIAISEVFGRFGTEFRALSAQAVAFHDEFVSLLNGGAAAYLSTEIANAGQGLRSAANAPAQTLLSNEAAVLPGLLTPAAVAAVGPGGAYGQLVANTTANLQSLSNSWAADPFPFLRQVIVNQQGYWQQIATGLASTIQNFPAVLANLPVTVQAGIQQLLAFNAANYVQQFITTQIGFAREFVTNLSSAVTGIMTGLPAFGAGLQVALQAAIAGDYFGAVQDVAQAFANLLVTGVSPGTPAIGLVGTTLTATVNPTLLGPLGNLFTIANIPGQEAQYFTNLMPPSIPRQMAQNLTNVLNILTIPSISAIATLPLTNPTAGSLSAFFGLPLVITYAAAGAPLATLTGLATTATAVQQALLAGNGAGALGALVNAPAVVANGFLNGETLVDVTVPVATGLPAPLPTSISIVLHLPFDGILVPPHPVTGTVVVPGLFSTPVTIFGTPFMGLVPLMVNFLPQQLAAAITPTG